MSVLDLASNIVLGVPLFFFLMIIFACFASSERANSAAEEAKRNKKEIESLREEINKLKNK